MIKLVSKELVVFYFLFSVLLCACNKDDENSYITVFPDQYGIVMHSDDVQTFNIKGETTLTFSKIEVSYKPDNDFSQTLENESISGSNIDYDYEFKAPLYIEDTITATLNFTAELSNGEKVKTAKRLFIISGYNLSETAGNVLYSGSSYEPNAFNLQNGTPLYYSLNDTTNIHIADTSSFDFNGDEISRTWISNTGIRFVRYADFDYANAKLEDLKSSFEAGIPREYISNIKDGDVLLIAFDHNKSVHSYAAMYITQVIDSEGTLNDRYIFSIKK
ncbi:MAG: hypothetical protein JEZ09_09105 [Salinivirgaceae bacterium]|nr:hypothetical protein [Salinivirgaceae bacterium]